MDVFEHITFTAKDDGWFVARGLIGSDMESQSIAYFLAFLSNVLNSRIPTYLGEVIDVDGVQKLASKFRGRDLLGRVEFLKSPKTSRKLVALIKEKDRKLRRLLIDVAKGVLVRSTINGLYYPEKTLTGREVEPRFEGNHVDFTAKHGRWIVVKRILIDEKTLRLDVAYVLASINDTVVSKLPVYAGIDLKGIEGHLGVRGRGKVKKAAIPGLVERYTGLDVTQHAPEEFSEHARVYALRTLLKSVGLSPDVPVKPLRKYLEKAFT